MYVEYIFNGRKMVNENTMINEPIMLNDCIMMNKRIMLNNHIMLTLRELGFLGVVFSGGRGASMIPLLLFIFQEELI